MGRPGKYLRRSAIFAVVTVICTVGPACADAAPLLWAVNSAEDSVSTIDPTTGATVGTPIATGEGPGSIAITPDGRRAYVADSGGESVTVIEAATRLPVATIPLAESARQVAVSADGSTAYVTAAGGRLFEISTQTNAIVGSVDLGSEASAVAAASDASGLAYVGVAPADLQTVDPRTGDLVGPPVELGGSPRAIAVSPDGKVVYVAAGEELDEVEAGRLVKAVPIGSEATNLAVGPDGTRLYVTSGSAETVTVIAASSGEVFGGPIALPGEPGEIALGASGRTAYAATGSAITPIDLVTRRAGDPIARPGSGVSRLVVAPDQPPVAAFESPPATAGVPVTLSGAASTDPDGSIAAYQWALGDGGLQAGATVTHTYAGPGTYLATLSVTDDEGCGTVRVFTGRTAYCAGGPGSAVTHPVAVGRAAPSPLSAPLCPSALRIGRVAHNLRNGTVRLRVRLPAAGSIFLFGRKIHAVTRKSTKPGSLSVTLHPRVEVNKRLKKVHRTGVRYRVTFYPAAGCSSTTVHRSLALLRAPKKKS